MIKQFPRDKEMFWLILLSRFVQALCSLLDVKNWIMVINCWHNFQRALLGKRYFLSIKSISIRTLSHFHGGYYDFMSYILMFCGNLSFKISKHFFWENLRNTKIFSLNTRLDAVFAMFLAGDMLGWETHLIPWPPAKDPPTTAVFSMLFFSKYTKDCMLSHQSLKPLTGVICDIISSLDVLVLCCIYSTTNQLPAHPRWPPVYWTLILHWENKDIRNILDITTSDHRCFVDK